MALLLSHQPLSIPIFNRAIHQAHTNALSGQFSNCIVSKNCFDESQSLLLQQLVEKNNIRTWVPNIKWHSHFNDLRCWRPWHYWEHIPNSTFVLAWIWRTIMIQNILPHIKTQQDIYIHATCLWIFKLVIYWTFWSIKMFTPQAVNFFPVEMKGILFHFLIYSVLHKRHFAFKYLVEIQRSTGEIEPRIKGKTPSMKFRFLF